MMLLIAVGRWPEGLPGGNLGGVSTAQVQTCIVHLIRYSMQFASCKERKLVAAALSPSIEPRMLSVHVSASKN